MSPESSYQITVVVLVVIGFISGVRCDDEYELVMDLKRALAAESYTKVFDSWRRDISVCNFTGISCDVDTTGVKEIDLSNQNLSGSIPFDSICQLRSLEKLSLGFNYLQGSVTDDLNKCSRLTYLDLGNNLFSGVMPDIHSITGLLYLYVNNSGFSGTFPWASLESMTGLVVLSVGDNPNFDPTPFPKQVLKLTNLTWLYMANCSIGGQIPAGIGELKELINFEISSNLITGQIPSEISRLVNLWQLELFANNLTGKLPVGLRNLTNLQFFDASSNYLEGDLSEVKFLTQLKSLQLFENRLIGEIPPEIGEFKHLVNLSLYRNQLTGTLPQQLGSWSDFNFIDVSENLLTGQIPPDMCRNNKMTELLMLDNNFTGAIPASYAHCKTLSRFRVSDNMLSGVVPSGLWGLPGAKIIDIANNNLEGGITSGIENAKTLGQIFAAHNLLSGELPPEISKAASLNTIDLSHNQFSGKLPATIGDLKHLDSLHLDHNYFTGQIPSSFGSCDSLSEINMAYNSFSGHIPAALGWLPTLNSLNLSSNQLSGEIPGSLSSPRLSLLDLSHNKLAGAIPESLSIDAYNGSFAGNAGLCSQKVIKYFRRCPSHQYTGGVSPVVIRTLITCLSVGSAVGLLLLCYLKKQKNKSSAAGGKEEEALTWNVKSFHVLSFIEDDIIDSVKEENLIGKGGSGQVYRVSLKNGMELAVKHISKNHLVGKSLEFEAEVRTLSSIRHVNVVKLYCSITNQESRLLVYEYLANGSLWDRLHNNKKLDWITRYEIALGAAKGLEYLHHGCETPVVHRDVKSSNILLDEHLKPRIADFGLAKIGGDDTTCTHVIAGTHGYIAPEYGYTYKVNEKSDVYSFGVVLMELVTGRKPIEAEYGENKDIVYWVCSKLKNKESVLSLVDASIAEAYKEETIKVLKIAIMCTSRLPTLRPTMRAVVKMLEEAEPCKLLGIIVSKKDNNKQQQMCTYNN